MILIGTAKHEKGYVEVSGVTYDHNDNGKILTINTGTYVYAYTTGAYKDQILARVQAYT